MDDLAALKIKLEQAEAQRDKLAEENRFLRDECRDDETTWKATALASNEQVIKLAAEVEQWRSDNPPDYAQVTNLTGEVKRLNESCKWYADYANNKDKLWGEEMQRAICAEARLSALSGALERIEQGDDAAFMRAIAKSALRAALNPTLPETTDER